MDLSRVLDWHQQHFPAMEPMDVVKLVFQCYCGCGHLLVEEDTVIRRIEAEMAQLSPAPNEPWIQPLGDYVRLNLRRAMAAHLPPTWIARMMKLSMPSSVSETARIDAFEAIMTLDMHAMDQPQISLKDTAQRLMDDPTWLPNHSETYHSAYHPAYRVLSKRFVWLLEALSVLGQHASKKHLLVCIDGPCASGKSTMAEQLAAITDAALIHMDDFYTPHALKTPERLAQPAGNADIERFLTECLHPWLENHTTSFRPYRCHEDAFGETIHVPQRPVTIIEGSYSLHPDIAKHADIKLWVSAPRTLRHQRILLRNGEDMLQRFINQWIPLEEAYMSVFSLPGEDCICLSGTDDEDVQAV